MPAKNKPLHKSEPYKTACALVEAQLIEDVASGKIKIQPDYKQFPLWAEKAVRHSCEQSDPKKARESLARAGVKDEKVMQQLMQTVFGSNKQQS